VSEVMCFSNWRLHCYILFCCSVQDWELEALALFLDMLYSLDVWGVGAGKVCWKLAMKRDFEVRGFYHFLYYILLLPILFL